MERVRSWAVPVALVAVTLADAAANGASAFPTPLPLSAGALVLACLSLGVRRSRPVAAAVAASALVTGYLLLEADPSRQPVLAAFLVMLVAFFNLGLHADRSVLPLGATAAALPLLAVELSAVAAGRSPADVAPTLIFWTGAAVLGRVLHRRSGEADRARERAAEAERSAAVAAETERNRIARELHDVVAHSLSAMVIHASVERRLVAERDSTTWRTLETIERTGRTALAELRTIVGLLRQGAEPSPLEPLPTLKLAEALVDPLRAAGHEVTLTVTGEADGLSAGVDLSAYRILQEAVTNALKHAPGSAVRVRIDYAEDVVVVEVHNDAPLVPAGPAPEPGHGLVGMRERVQMYGGQLSTGHRDGAFHVRAELPRPAP